jgi:hypothetical protein
VPRTPKRSPKALAFLRKVISPAALQVYTENMMRDETLVYEVDTPRMHYQVVDMIYDGRPARVLFSGNREAAQSGIALDGKPDLLFDYNQRFYEIVENLQPVRFLLIGGGVYTLPMAVRQRFPRLHITVVEPDAGLDDVAHRYFGWQPDELMTVIHSDGRAFIDATIERFDLILVDAFSHTSMPTSLATTQAIEQLKRCLVPNGAVAVNLISAYYGRGAELIRRQYSRYSRAFNYVEIFPANRSLLSFWLSQNFVLVAYAGRRRPLELRFEALDPPA